MTTRQMSYEMLLEAVEGLETFFSEVQGGYFLVVFFVLARGSRRTADGYGFGRLMVRRAGVEQGGVPQASGCNWDGEEGQAEDAIQVDRLVRD